MPSSPPTLQPGDTLASRLDATATPAPVHASDRVPGWVLRVYAWTQGLMSSESRLGLGLLSYSIAGARTAESYRTGDAAGAEQLATEAGMLGETDPSAGAVVSSEQHAATDVFAAPADAPAEVPPDVSIMKRLERRFIESLRKAQVRAQPDIEKHGVRGNVPPLLRADPHWAPPRRSWAA